VREKTIGVRNLERAGRRKGSNEMQRQRTNSTNQPEEQDDSPVTQQPESFRPDESDRLARAKKWLEQARGESPEPE